MTRRPQSRGKHTPAQRTARAALNVMINRALDETNPRVQHRMLMQIAPLVPLTQLPNRVFNVMNKVVHHRIMTHTLLNSTNYDDIRVALRRGGDASKITTDRIRQLMYVLVLDPTNTGRAERGAKLLIELLHSGAGCDVHSNRMATRLTHKIRELQVKAFTEYNDVFLKLLKALFERGYHPAGLPPHESHGISLYYSIRKHGVRKVVSHGIPRWIKLLRLLKDHGVDIRYALCMYIQFCDAARKRDANIEPDPRVVKTLIDMGGSHPGVHGIQSNMRCYVLFGFSNPQVYAVFRNAERQ